MARHYGFTDGTYGTVIEREADGIRYGASFRVLGQVFRVVCDEVNAKGYRSVQGKLFQPPTYARILHNPVIAGLKEDEDGKLVDSGGPRIIPVKDFLTIRGMRTSTEREANREYLVSARLGDCGLCGHDLHAEPTNSGKRGYRCRPSKVTGACGGVRISADPFETYLAEQVVAELAKPEVAALLGQARDVLLRQALELQKEAKAIRLRQTQLGKDYSGSGLSFLAFKAADKGLADQAREKAEKARFLRQAQHVPVGDIPDLVRWWGHAPLVAKQGVLVLCLEKVVLYPAEARGSRLVDGDRVALHWRDWARTKL